MRTWWNVITPKIDMQMIGFHGSNRLVSILSGYLFSSGNVLAQTDQTNPPNNLELLKHGVTRFQLRSFNFDWCYEMNLRLFAWASNQRGVFFGNPNPYGISPLHP